MNEKEKCLLKDFDTAFVEGLAVRLRNIEAFVYHQLVADERAIASYAVKDSNGNIIEHEITETETFETIFGRHEDLEDLWEELAIMVKDTLVTSAEAAQRTEDVQERQAKQVAEYKAAEAVKAKGLAALKAEGDKKRREAYKVAHEKELERIAQRRAKEEAYEETLQNATEADEDIYIGGRMKKLAD